MTDPAEALGFGRTPPHDYDLRPPRRWRAPWSRTAVAGLTALGALVVGFLVTTGLSAGRDQAVAQYERKDELIALITERQEHADELAAELDELRSRVDAAQAEAAEGLPALQSDIEGIELAAGLVGLRGPGLRLTLDDAPPSCPGNPYECRIQDQDVQLAVNALFESGAEAVAVGGERVTATTAIRAVGQTVRVNMRVMAAPFEIEALGDVEHMAEAFAETDFARDFDDWSEQFGFPVGLEEVDELEIPRFSGTIGMDARPSDETTAVGR